MAQHLHAKMPSLFQAGGALREGAIYVTRPADADLPEALRDGHFCYVLAPRQMGKSSLKVRCAASLRREGIECAEIDLTDIGSRDVSASQWYFGLIDEIANQLDLPVDTLSFWEEHKGLSPVHTWSRFLRDHLAQEHRPPTVIFVDEIDGVLSFGFSIEDFFASIRACYNHRAAEGSFKNLTFCLLGVAAPTDLMRDPTRTPFNVGKRIELEDFTRAEAETLLPGLESLTDDKKAYLASIMGWTAGHPYMTQRICDHLVQNPPQHGRASKQVRRVVEKLFINPGPLADSNLEAARNRLINSGERLPDMLRLYERLIKGSKIEVDERDPVQLSLRLAGMISQYALGKKAYIKIRNPIFATTFNLNWVQEQLESRPFAHALSRWIQSDRSDDDVLRGTALSEASAWASQRKDLTPDEAAFLLQAIKVKHEQDRERQALERLAQEREIEAQRHLALQERSASQRQRIQFLTVVSIMLTAILMGGGFLFKRIQEDREAKKTAIAHKDLAHEKAEKMEAAKENATLELQSVRSELESLRIEAQWRAESLTKAENERQAAEKQAELAREREEEAIEELKKLRVDSDQTSTLLATKEAEIRQANQALKAAEASLKEMKRIEERAMVAERAVRAELLSKLPGQAQSALEESLRSMEMTAQNTDNPTALYALSRVVSNVNGPSLLGHTASVADVVFAPDGRSAASASWDNTARIWSVPSGKIQHILTGHQNLLTSIAFSPDNRRILTTSRDKSARIWDRSTGRLLYTLDGHENSVVTATHSRDGKRILTAGLDGSLRLWNAQDGTLIQPLKSVDSGIKMVDFSADDAHFLSADQAGRIHLWKTESGRQIRSMMIDPQGISHAAFLPEQKRIVITDNSGKITLWDYEKRQTPMRINAHTGSIFAASPSPDGRRLVTVGQLGVAKIWSLDDGVLLRTLQGHEGPINDVTYAQDGKLILTAGEDRSIRVWDALTGESFRVLNGHSGAVKAIDISPKGDWIISGGHDNRAKLWHTYSGLAQGIMSNHHDGITSLAISPDSGVVVTASRDSTLALSKLPTGETLGILSGHSGEVRFAEFTPDGQRLITAGEDGDIKFWDRDSQMLLGEFLSHDGPIVGLDIHQKSDLAASHSEGNTALLWDYQRGVLKQRVTVGGGAISQLSLSPDASTLAIADIYGEITLWQTQNGRLKGSGKIHPNPTALEWSPDGERLVAATTDGTYFILDSERASILAQESAQRGKIFALTHSPDGALFAVATQNGSILLVDGKSGAMKSKLIGHRRAVKTLEFDPTGQHLISGGFDHRAILWHIASATFLAVYDGHRGAIHRVKFSPDGQWVVTGGDDALALIHPSTPQGMVSRACNWLESDGSARGVPAYCRQ